VVRTWKYEIIKPPAVRAKLTHDATSPEAWQAVSAWVGNCGKFGSLPLDTSPDCKR
jgi:hypothetical protein